MELLTIALNSLIVLVIVHIAAYWVVKTLYPPTHSVVPVPVAVPIKAQPVFTEPPSIEQQNVVVPTYETPVPVEAPRQEGERRGPPPPESTSIHGNPGVVVSNT